MTLLKTILRENNLEEGFELLTKREKQIINLYYLEGYKDAEIAKIYDIRRQSVNECRQNGIKKLKYFF